MLLILVWVARLCFVVMVWVCFGVDVVGFVWLFIWIALAFLLRVVVWSLVVGLIWCLVLRWGLACFNDCCVVCYLLFCCGDWCFGVFTCLTSFVGLGFVGVEQFGDLVDCLGVSGYCGRMRLVVGWFGVCWIGYCAWVLLVGGCVFVVVTFADCAWCWFC